MCENPVTRIHKGLPEGYALQRGPGPEYRWCAMRITPTEYCLPDPDRPGIYLSFPSVEDGLAWFAVAFGAAGADNARRNVGRPHVLAAP
jgi:hypothetical protein